MKNLLFALVILLLLGSCKNELEINSDWVETPVVYGFLDAYKDTQYIRVQKTYQNSVNQTTKEAAQIADSLYFDTSFHVSVVTNFGEEYAFKRVPLPKQPGMFENGTHYIYQCPNFKPGSSGVYTRIYYLRMVNTKSGKIYWSNPTSLVDSAQFGTSNNIVNITTPDLQGNIGSLSYKVLRVGANAKIYDLFIRMNYDEYYPDGSSAPKYLDYFVQHNWHIDNSIVSYPASIKARAYIDFLKANINADAGVSYRKYKNITYYASGGTEDLAFLTDLSQPSTTIVPKNTQYTNIPGALGLFSSLSIHTINPYLPTNNVIKPTIVAEVPLFVN